MGVVKMMVKAVAVEGVELEVKAVTKGVAVGERDHQMRECRFFKACGCVA